MLDILFWIAVGAFIGWNLPQPVWARWIESAVKNMIAKINTKK